jgi:hypothetical protein
MCNCLPQIGSGIAFLCVIASALYCTAAWPKARSPKRPVTGADGSADGPSSIAHHPGKKAPDVSFRHIGTKGAMSNPDHRMMPNRCTVLFPFTVIFTR